VLSSQAKVTYIGNDFYNEGVATTARLAFDLDANLPSVPASGLSADAYFLQYGTPLPQILPDSFSEIAALPGARVFPITQAINMINPPHRFDYQPIKEAWSPFYGGPHGDYGMGTSGGKDVVFAGVMYNQLTSSPTYETVATDGIFGVGYAPVTFFAATGLALMANNPLSILVEARCCVEYTLAYTSPSARFASLPPPERPLAIRSVHDFGRLLPSSVPTTPAMESAGWLSRAWNWYYPKEKAGITAAWRVGGNIIDRITGGFNSMAIESGRGRGGQLAIGY